MRFADGELAYLTRRFDRREGLSVRQEDLCQIAGRSEESHGSAYKYDFSYEEMAEVIRAAVPASRIELPKVFRQIVFDYVFANGDACGCCGGVRFGRGAGGEAAHVLVVVR